MTKTLVSPVNHKVSNILTPRTTYKPFEAPWAFELYKRQQAARWTVEEISLNDDVEDWNNKLTDSERNFLTQIFSD